MAHELIGRAQLWSSALTDAANCLDLADRLSHASGSSAVQAEEVGFKSYFLAKAGRELDPHVAYSSDDAIAVGFQRALPSSSECVRAADYLRKLAVIYFGQVYTQGRADPGNVAGNFQVEATRLRDSVEQAAFQGADELKAFQLLKDALVKLRHQQLGHADGQAFGIRHSANAVVCTVDSVPYELCVELRLALRNLLPAILASVGGLIENLSKG